MNNEGGKKKAYKIVLVGPQASGKSSLLHRIASSKFDDTYTTTIGVDFKTIKISNGDKEIPIQLWDTAGQQKFKSLTRSYYKGSHASICVFDLQDQQSLKRCQYYLEQALGELINNECIYLVGNKSDEGKTYSNEGKELADQFEVGYCEVSAKTGEGVQSLISKLASQMMEKHGVLVQKATEIRPNIEINDKKKCSC